MDRNREQIEQRESETKQPKFIKHLVTTRGEPTCGDKNVDRIASDQEYNNALNELIELLNSAKTAEDQSKIKHRVFECRDCKKDSQEYPGVYKWQPFVLKE